MNILSKNNNQASLPVKVYKQKVSIQIFNSNTLNGHVSTNNYDVCIPKQIKIVARPKNINVNIIKDVDIPKNININIPQNINVNIPSKNNDQSSVPVKLPLNKQSIQIFNSDIVRLRWEWQSWSIP